MALGFAWPFVRRFLSPCLFQSLVGIPCPSCGSTRAMEALVQGNLLAAVTFNPLVVFVILVFLTGGLFVAPLWLLMRGKLPQSSSPPRRVALILAALVVVNWIYLLIQL
ncbi:MAG: DUF2752 domain-containing protein [bacterium]|nr:DUF2752 domain-containing protein [bacterium]